MLLACSRKSPGSRKVLRALWTLKFLRTMNYFDVIVDFRGSRKVLESPQLAPSDHFALPYLDESGRADSY
jgi:hypothetical protein